MNIAYYIDKRQTLRFEIDEAFIKATTDHDLTFAVVVFDTNSDECYFSNTIITVYANEYDADHDMKRRNNNLDSSSTEFYAVFDLANGKFTNLPEGWRNQSR